jgi:site-specific DNA recombinase
MVVSSRDSGNEDHIGKITARLFEVGEELAVLQGASIDRRDLARALALFDEVWACLFPREQERVIALLVERVDFDRSLAARPLLSPQPTAVA